MVYTIESLPLVFENNFVLIKRLKKKQKANSRVKIDKSQYMQVLLNHEISVSSYNKKLLNIPVDGSVKEFVYSIKEANSFCQAFPVIEVDGFEYKPTIQNYTGRDRIWLELI